MPLSACFDDLRLEDRFRRILAQLSVSVSKSVQARLVNRDQVKAYYRFINNKKVKPEMIRDSYLQASIEALESYSGLILSVQDTTELDYSKKRSAKHLGSLSYEHRKGMFLHNHLLLRASGAPLGFFSQRFYSRNPDGSQPKISRKLRPIEEKESYRWLAEYESLEKVFGTNTARTFLCICDREADIYELLQARNKSHIHYLIRSQSNRKQDQEPEKIHDFIDKEPLAFEYSLDLPPRKKEPARTARLSVRYGKVRIHPPYRPKGQKQLKAVEVGLIQIKEEHPETGIKPICWRLLTSMPIESNEQVVQLIQFYVLRWVIERFHYVLKQGFEVEKRQIENPQALKNAISLDSWQALQICTTHYLAQVKPELPATEMGVKTRDFLILIEFLKQKYQIKLPHQEKPTIRDLQLLWAVFGGFQRQKNKSPGMVTLWRGWKKCDLILQAFNFEKDVGN